MDYATDNANSRIVIFDENFLCIKTLSIFRPQGIFIKDNKYTFDFKTNYSLFKYDMNMTLVRKTSLPANYALHAIYVNVTSYEYYALNPWVFIVFDRNLTISNVTVVGATVARSIGIDGDKIYAGSTGLAFIFQYGIPESQFKKFSICSSGSTVVRALVLVRGTDYIIYGCTDESTLRLYYKNGTDTGKLINLGCQPYYVTYDLKGQLLVICDSPFILKVISELSQPVPSL